MKKQIAFLLKSVYAAMPRSIPSIKGIRISLMIRLGTYFIPHAVRLPFVMND